MQCVDRWKLSELPLETARVEQVDGQYWLYPQRKDVLFRFQRASWEQPKGLESLADSASTINQLIAGRTSYQVTAIGDYLEWIPRHRLHLFAQAPEMQTGQHWESAAWSGEWAALTAPRLSFWISLGVILWGAWLLARWNRAFWRSMRQSVSVNLGMIMLLVPSALFLLGWQVIGQNLLYLLIAWWVSTVWLTALMWFNRWLDGLSGWLWCLLLLLIGTGVLVQVQLAAGADSTHWLRYPQRYLLFLLAINSLLSFVCMTPWQVWERVWQGLMSGRGLALIILWAFIVLLALLLGMQMFQGTESGLGFLQPVEMVKLVFLVLLAKLLLDMNESRRMRRDQSIWLLIKRFALGALIAFVGFITVTLGVRDFSPLLILISLMLAYLWLVLRHPVTPRFQSVWGGRALLLGLLLLIVVIPGYFLHQFPASGFAELLPQSERFLIWSNPWSYPDTGRQLQLSLEYVHMGGWFGQAWFGSNGQIMNLPAIQDDFILSFLLYKWGGLVGVLLLTVQLSWLGMLFYLSRHLLLDLPTERDARLQQAMLAYVLYGLAWMQLLHWLISWGNVLGLLPIMGQPMTWLSSGNSHLLAIALPTVLLAMLASRLRSGRG